MMTTVLTRSSRTAAQFIHAGEVVAFPTETVYGLGADVFRAEAIRKIFRAKRRPADNPLIAHIADLTQLAALVRRVSPAAEKLIAAFFPGPLTIVLPKSARVPLVATAGLYTLGVRMPLHATAQRFLRACDTPLVAPSANLSGRPSPTTWRAVETDLAGRISCILQGGATKVGLESTVVDCTRAATSAPLILRAGAITLEDLQAVVPETRILPQLTKTPQDVRTAMRAAHRRSPGTRYRHYAPHARVFPIAHPDDALRDEMREHNIAYIGLDAPTNETRGEGKTKTARRTSFARQLICRDVAQYAHEVFAFFRECDATGVTRIYCQTVDETGLGLALMDRLRRAAEEKN